MRRIDQNEPGSYGGGGLYPRTHTVTTDQPEPLAAPRPARQFADIVIRRMSHLRGPNVWTYRAVIEAVVTSVNLRTSPPTPCPASISG